MSAEPIPFDRRAGEFDRRSGLGASEAAFALGLMPKRKTALQLYLEKIGEADPDPEPTLGEGDPREMGTLLEDDVATMFERRSRLRIVEVADLRIRHPRLPWLWATLDRVIEDGSILECKTSGQGLGFGAEAEADDESDDEGEVTVTDAIPDHVAVQAHVQLACYPTAPRCHVGAILAPGFGPLQFRLYTVKRDNALIEVIEKGLDEFWTRVKERRPPDPVTSQEANRAWRAIAGSTKNITAEELDVIVQLVAVRKARKDAIEAEKAIALKAKLIHGEIENLIAPNGQIVSSYKTQPSPRVDAKALKEQEPKIYARFLRDNGSRVLRPKVKE